MTQALNHTNRGRGVRARKGREKQPPLPCSLSPQPGKRARECSLPCGTQIRPTNPDTGIKSLGERDWKEKVTCTHGDATTPLYVVLSCAATMT
jgi:hypothetical protein